jgi:elongator complex protein 3
MSEENTDQINMFKELLSDGSTDSIKEFNIKKRILTAKLHLDVAPKNSEIMATLSEDERATFGRLLRSKPIRNLSGVSVVTVMTKPFPCPHGVCVFCPGGPRYGTPQSYTGKEPAARRASRNHYDPYRQVSARLKHYTYLGYPPDKIELIVIGGTFTTLPKDYMRAFVTELYRALNDFPSFNQRKATGTLQEEKNENERAKARCVAFAVETKPERCKEEDIKLLLELGVTRVEIGVQSLFDDVLKFANRGHDVKDVVQATSSLRQNGYKTGYHIMLNLPKSDIDRDKETIRRVYEDEDFMPDSLKIYPTLVLAGTGLFNLWKTGMYKVYRLEEISELISYAEATAPRWLRIMRIERDIPSDLIKDGVKYPNLRQLVLERMAKWHLKPNDIRSREIGHVKLEKRPEISMKRSNYRTSNGDEVFLSFEDTANDALVGFLRLRLGDNAKEALVRELHVYGEQSPLSVHTDTAFQHHGFGSSLLGEAERIAGREYSKRKVKVISGVGVKDYYRKFGYRDDGQYVSKSL